MVVGAVAGGAAIGAGVGISSVALMPFNAANTFLGSAFFGYGMILGERYMYQADWPKIQARLEHGEKIENIIQEYTGVFQAVVMREAKIIFDSVTKEMIDIIKASVIPEGSTLSDLEHFVHGHGAGHETITTPTAPTSEISGGTVGGVTLPPTQVPTTNKYTLTYALKFASGRVMNNVNTSTFYVHTNLKLAVDGGLWRSLLSGTFSKMTAAAMASWPSAGYHTVKIEHDDKRMHTYWFLNKY